MVKLLIEKGADVNAAATRNVKVERKALSLATEGGFSKIVKLLKAHGASE